MTKPNIDSNIDVIAQKIMDLAKQARLDELPPPADIEYGFGWDPTLSFWHAQRRIHLYWHWPYNDDDGLTVEVAEQGSDHPVLLGMVYSYEELFDLIVKFLKSRCSFADLPDCGWKTSDLAHDKFIPHPPDQAGFASGNIAAFVEHAQIHGKPGQPLTGSKPKNRFRIWIDKLIKHG